MTPGGHFTGRYNDGRTARTTSVDVAMGGAGLRISSPDGTVDETWPAAQVTLAAPPDPNEPLRLRHADGPARLTVEDTAVLASLRIYCPNLFTGVTTSRREWRKIALWATAAATVALVIFFLVIPVGSQWLATRIPAPLEVRLGRQVAAQITAILARGRDQEAAEIVCSSPAGTAALTALADRLQGAAPTHVPIQITVLDHPLVNAFALPGGQVLLFRGLIDQAPNAEQVAGVLAHEVGHVLHRHPTEITFKNTAGAGLISLLVGDFTGGAAIATAGQLLATTSNTREAERQADATAVAILNELGIAAEPLAAFFDGVDAGPAFAFMNYLSTHPANADRIAAIRAHGHAAGKAMSSRDWRAVQRICD